MKSDVTVEAAVEPLLPVRIPRGEISLAPGVRAGRWIFATGVMATGPEGGVPPDLVNADLPLRGKPPNEAEAECIFERLKHILQAGGSDPSRIVRLDQYYTTWKAVPHYHVARHRAFRGTKSIPASTSILESRLLIPGVDIELEMTALGTDAGITVEGMTPTGLEVPPVMGFAPIVRAGDFVFLAGQMAEDGEKGIAAEARVPSTHLWRGHRVKLETEYILKHKFAPALKAAGSSFENVVKAQVYLSDISEAASFGQVWAEFFPKSPPVTTIVPTAKPGFNCIDASLEINLIALTDDGATQREAIGAPGIHTAFEHQSAAIRAGDLLMLSGLMAIDEKGLIEAARPDPAQPFFGSTIKAQMEHILDTAERLCRASGTSLENTVRAQHFHTNLGEFYGGYEVWRRRLGDRPLPISAVEVPSPLPAPGCTVQLDLWVYVP